jgi:predicted nucleic acid-binding protein
MPSLVIADTSCLILLDKINGFQILHKVYNEIITTPEIADEFRKLLPSWIKVEKVKDTKYQIPRISINSRVFKNR